MSPQNGRNLLRMLLGANESRRCHCPGATLKAQRTPTCTSCRRRPVCFHTDATFWPRKISQRVMLRAGGTGAVRVWFAGAESLFVRVRDG